MAIVKCPECGADIDVEAFRVDEVVPKPPAGYSDVSKAISEHRLCLHGVSLAGEEDMAAEAEKIAQEKLSEKVRGQGHVKNHRLYRRWILAQLFQMMHTMYGGESFAERVRDRGVRYMWRVVKEETHDMAVIRKNGDMDEFRRRWRWWSSSVVRGIAEDYMDVLVGEIKKLKFHKCEGREYKRIPGYGMVFCDQIDADVLNPIRRAIGDVSQDVPDDDCVARLCSLMSRFKESRRWKVRMPTSFINAFKGNGAYFGLRNLILFHGCKLPGLMDRTVAENEAELDRIAEERRSEGEGWKLLGLFRDTVKSNGIDMGGKLREWRSRKA